MTPWQVARAPQDKTSIGVERTGPSYTLAHVRNTCATTVTTNVVLGKVPHQRCAQLVSLRWKSFTLGVS